MSAMADKQVEVSTEIRADAGQLYDMVSELTQMGEWSPESTGGQAGSVAQPVLRLVREVPWQQPLRVASLVDNGAGHRGRARQSGSCSG